MKLQEMTWPEVEAVSRDCVVLIPTGSLEQHGAHLPLFTDSIIVSAVAEAVEAHLKERVLLTPTLWLGASGHHLAFPGTLSNDFDSYMGAISSIVDSLSQHGFHKFYVINGHGGNDDPNGLVTRKLKLKYPNSTFVQIAYYSLCPETIAEQLDGPQKQMAHASEAETSLILFLRPDLVRTERVRNDGLSAAPPIRGLLTHFDEISVEGSVGYAALASSEKGETIFRSVVGEVVRDVRNLCDGYVFKGLSQP